MFTPKLCVVVAPTDHAQLTALAADGSTAQKTATRARLLLMLGDRMGPSQIARRLGLSRNHMHYWVRRCVALGVPGIVRDATRPGRHKPLTPDTVATIVNATLTTTPGATQRSTRTMARAQGASEKTIRNIWHQHGLQPHRVTPFKLSKDPHFVTKLRDVVGLYLKPKSSRTEIQCIARYRRSRTEIQCIARYRH
jgi:DNA-binding CsgD family transcriptional regulator